METGTFNWNDSLIQTFNSLVTQVMTFAPHIISVTVLLIVGWIMAHILRISSKKLVKSITTLLQRVTKTQSIQEEKIQQYYAAIISRVIFWIVMIFFIAVAANMLGWKMFFNWMNGIITYLPSFISGLLIILTGFFLGSVAKAAIIRAGHSTGTKRVDVLARMVQLIILFTALIIGVEQIGINVDFLTHVLIVTIGILLAGAALAFGLGAKVLVSNVIGAQYARKHYRIGDNMQIDTIEGDIIDITQTSIILETDTGRTIIPAHYFQQHISMTVSSNSISAKKEKNDESSEN